MYYNKCLERAEISISCLTITLKLHPNKDPTKSQTFIKRQNDDSIKTNIKSFNACV